MQKKPGQISATTLGLRFMQNAAKAKQEQEVEAAQAKVRSEEEWEVSASVRERWGIGDCGSDEQGAVVYEQSYIPFLFKSLPSNDANGEGEDTTRISIKGRRVFGKQGKEETIQAALSEPAPSSSSSLSSSSKLPRTISSRGPSVGQRPLGFMRPQVAAARERKKRTNTLADGAELEEEEEEEGQRERKKRKDKA